jgi:hypothetical protein
MPLATPPIQRSRPRWIPWLRTQSKKVCGWMPACGGAAPM